MTDPSYNLIEEESNHLFLCYCTFIENIVGKKLSNQNVFIITLENEKYKKILKEILNLETDYEIVRVFLDIDPSIAKSKFVTKFLNNRNK